MIVASTVGSAALFALLAGILTQTLGRKLTILTASVVFVAGSVIMGIALSKELLLGKTFISSYFLFPLSLQPVIYLTFHIDSVLLNILTSGCNYIWIFKKSEFSEIVTIQRYYAVPLQKKFKLDKFLQNLFIKTSDFCRMFFKNVIID